MSAASRRACVGLRSSTIIPRFFGFWRSHRIDLIFPPKPAPSHTRRKFALNISTPNQGESGTRPLGSRGALLLCPQYGWDADLSLVEYHPVCFRSLYLPSGGNTHGGRKSCREFFYAGTDGGLHCVSDLVVPEQNCSQSVCWS